MRSYSKLTMALDAMSPGSLLLARDLTEDGVKRYYLYPNLDAFLSDTSHDPNWYEVLTGPCRLYLDIDIPISAKRYFGLSEAEARPYFDASIDLLIQHLQELLQTKRVNAYASHRIEDGQYCKYSYHLVVLDRIAPSVQAAGATIKTLIEAYARRGGQLVPFVDLTVYKRNQLFRLLGSHKKGQNNTKIPFRGTTSFQDSLLGYGI